MVAIKGMKMPENCMECPLFDGEYGDCNIIGETKADATEERAENCPLVEIVTCKDCKYWDKEEGYCKPSSGTIEWVDYIVCTSADSFCESAERRE